MKISIIYYSREVGLVAQNYYQNTTKQKFLKL